MNRGVEHAGEQRTDEPTGDLAAISGGHDVNGQPGGHALGKQPDVSRFLDRPIGRGRFLEMLGMCAVAAVSASACSKLDQMFPREGAEQPTPTAEPEAPIREPNIEGTGTMAQGAAPNFLEQDLIRLKGLPLLMAQPQIDRYIFNSVSGNRSFTNVAKVHKSDKVPYHAFVFKAFDERSNVNLPPRLGNVDKRQSLADFFNGVTKYRGDHSGNVEEIKTILVTSYELSFGIKLDPEYIEVVPDGSGKIAAIKYTAADADQLEVTVKVADKLKKGDRELDPEVTTVVSSREENHKLVDKKGNLKFPPSIAEDQGIAIPPEALADYERVRYQQTFESQGKIIGVNLDIPIEALIDEHEALEKQGRPKGFDDGNVFSKNLGWYILDNDPMTRDIANIVTRQFPTKKEKMQAILDFVQSYRYVPDAHGDAPRTPLMSLICKGGDCEDSSILVAALAQAVGIECIFTYFPNHVATACDIIDEETSSFMTFNGKRYAWMETAGDGATSNTNKVETFHETELVRTFGISGGHKIGERPKTLPTHLSTVNGRSLVKTNWTSRSE